MTIFITGGTGKTGLVLSRLLKEANQSVLIGSRNAGTVPSLYKAVKFDWFDDKTFENPFKADSNIDRVYLVVPSVIGQLTTTVQPFIDFAISNGVNTFVLLTASQAEIGSPTLMGKVHEYLLNIKVNYTVLRPTWFMRTCFSIRIPSADKKIHRKLWHQFLSEHLRTERNLWCGGSWTSPFRLDRRHCTSCLQCSSFREKLKQSLLCCRSRVIFIRRGD